MQAVIQLVSMALEDFIARGTISTPDGTRLVSLTRSPNSVTVVSRDADGKAQTFVLTPECLTDTTTPAEPAPVDPTPEPEVPAAAAAIDSIPEPAEATTDVEAVASPECCEGQCNNEDPACDTQCADTGTVCASHDPTSDEAEDSGATS